MKSKIGNCSFCGAADLRLAHAGGFHPRKKDYGPFDLFQCMSCGGAITIPPPTPDALEGFYRAMTEFGMARSTRTLLAADSEAAWHDMSVRRLLALCGRGPADRFTWIDIGAGAGEMAQR